MWWRGVARAAGNGNTGRGLPTVSLELVTDPSRVTSCYVRTAPMRATVSTVHVLLIAYNFTMGTGSDQVNSPLAMHQLVGGLHVNKGLLNRPAPGLCDARLYKDQCAYSSEKGTSSREPAKILFRVASTSSARSLAVIERRSGAAVLWCRV